MDSQREAAWKAAIATSVRGEHVSSEEHKALFREDLYEGWDKVSAEEDATFVVRYVLSGRHLLAIPPRGPREAKKWFAMREQWGAERQEEKLRNMIAASKHDPDYWEALDLIAARLHDEGDQFPRVLATWASEVHRGRSKPRKRQSSQGKPHYANDVRNMWFARAFFFLVYLGLGETKSYEVIANEVGMHRSAVRDAIRSAHVQDPKIPPPWECWPPKD